MNAGKVILATLVIFIAGIFTGGLLVTMVLRLNGQHPLKQLAANSNPGNQAAVNPWQLRNRDLIKRMDRELNLSPDQHTNIERLVTLSQDRTKALWKPITPAMNKETQLLRNEIREVLNAEQKKKFDDFMKPHPAPDRRHGGTNSSTLTNGLSLTNSMTGAVLTNLSNSVSPPLATNLSNSLPGNP